MSKFVYGLALSLLFAATAPAQVQFSYPDRGAGTGSVHIPFDVTTPDGTAIPAGEYRINVREPLLKQIRRPDGSLGLWPGPLITLTPAAPLAEPVWFSLTTSVEVRVVYDMPGFEARRQRVRALAPEFFPFIRDGRLLTGIVFRGDILYIREARRLPVLRRPLMPR